MKTYKLFAIVAGERNSKYADAEARGIVEAEKKADELLEKYIHDYPSETYIVCVEDEFDMWFDDYLCWQKDYYGDKYWMKMVNGHCCPIGLRLLTDDEKEELDELREEKEIHIWDLDEEQLKKLRSEICVGSLYFSDYENSFEIDSDEVYNYSEGYLSFLEECGYEDTPEEFAVYCMSVEAY